MYQIGILVHKPVIYNIKPDSLAFNSGINFNKAELDSNDIIISKINGVENRYLDILINNSKNNKNFKFTLDLEKINFYKDIDLHSTNLAKPLGLIMIPDKIKVISVLENGPAKEAGLNKDDFLLGIKSQDLDIFEALDYIKKNPNKNVDLEILKNNKIISKPIQIGEKNNNGYIGILFNSPFNFYKQQYDLIKSFNISFVDTCKYIKKSFTMIFKLLFGEVGLENVHGPIMVAKVADKSWTIGFSQFLKFLGIISIGLGVINLLPVPLLDGGHIVYHLIEWINPKWITKSTEEILVKVGISFIIFLFFLAVYNDIKYW